MSLPKSSLHLPSCHSILSGTSITALIIWLHALSRAIRCVKCAADLICPVDLCEVSDVVVGACLDSGGAKERCDEAEEWHVGAYEVAKRVKS